MERLTNAKQIKATRKEIDHSLSSVGFLNIPLMRYVRLGEYEDIGLTPEEINDVLVVVSENQDDSDDSGISTGIIHSLLELAQYQKAGISPKSLKEVEKERDYWKSEAVKVTSKLGEIRILIDKQ